MVNPGDKVELSVETEGIDDGEKITISVWGRDIKKADSLVKSFDVKVSGNKAKADWEVLTETAGGNGYSNSDYYFTALSVPDLTARSGILYIEDYIEVELKDQDGNPVANEEYIFYLPSGEVRKGKLDGNGYKKEEKVPKGKYSITFPKLSRFKQD